MHHQGTKITKIQESRAFLGGLGALGGLIYAG